MRALIRITLVCLFACAAAWGQSTAQIHGTIQDSTGAAVPGAEVKATQTATGVSRTTTTAADGGYVLTNLPLGPYRLEVSKEGFTKAVESGVELQVNADPAVDVALKIGAVTEQVNVEANAAMVETRNSGVGSVIESQRIVELPLNGRNVTDLITLAGGSVVTGVTRSALFFNLSYISVGGGATFGTDYSLDGASHNNFMTGTYMPLAFPDAVQEFKVESSGQSAQRGAATSVSAVTKSGTNNLHGDLFYFIRNDGFGSAREYFAVQKSTYKRNQFGGTVGGAIMKNKLFFFGGYQSTIRRENPNNAPGVIPTQAMINGDFTAFAAPPCQPAQRTLASPFSGNKISAGLLVAPAVFEATQLLKSAAQDGLVPNGCGSITYNIPNDEDQRQYVGKIDYQLSDKQSVFFRILDTQELVPNAFSVDPILLNWGNTGLDQLAGSYAIGDTYLLSPNMVNSARIAVNRTAHRYIPNLAFSHCTAGVNMWCTENPQTIGAMSISGLTTMGSTSAKGEHWTGTSYAVNDDLNWVHGAHQFGFGGGAWQGRLAEYTHFASTGQTNFNGAGLQSTGGLGAADFFLGRLNTFFQGLPNTNSSRQNSVNLYATDTWKISSRLTFNFGIRWEPFLPQHAANISVFDMNRFLTGVRSTVFVRAPLGFYFPGDPGFPDSSATYRQWAHFDPRGGIAWDPKGDGKMSIRAAYAFGYAYVPGIQREDQAGSNPWGGRTTINEGGAAGSFVNPWQGTTGNPFPYLVNANVPFTPRGQFITSPYDLQTPNTYSWNVSVQRQIGASWLGSVSYIGSRVMHLYNNVAINYAQLVNGPIVTSGCAATATNCNSAANVDARRVLSLLNFNEGLLVGNMDRWDASGNQNYNALMFTAEKRLSHGVNMKANWTWSHCIGYFSGYNSKTDQTVTVPGNPLFDRGNCDSDRRHVVNITAVAMTPRFSNTLVRTIGSGWQVAGIYKFTSGTPISIQDGSDRELSGINHQRPNLIDPSHVYTGDTGPNAKYLNLAAFALQPLGTAGNLGWNSIVGPTYWDIDLAVSREFRLTERQSLQLRADAFNLTNSFVTLVPSTATPTSAAVPNFESLASSSQFGVLNGAQPTRKMQFALKYTF
jgi:Carboxypeptidase regulatory-like domain/TonB dependent receptor